jgi:hypothetical protein
LILFPALVFAATVRFDFVFDDNIVILGDPLVVRQFNPKEIFGSEVRVADVALGYYRPLITLLYRLDWALWGLNPAGYHLTNLVWHLLATFLIYRLALQTTGRLVAAWAGAMLFAVLPAHAEAIGWIQGRVDLVSTTFTLLALLALLRARDAGGPARWQWAALGGLAFLAALLAKESTAALPLAWAMWEVSGFRTDRGGERLAGVTSRFAPLCLAALAYWFLRWWAVGTSLSFFSMSLSPAALRALALSSVLAEYGRILLFLFPDLTLNFHQILMVAPGPTAVSVGRLGADHALAAFALHPPGPGPRDRVLHGGALPLSAFRGLVYSAWFLGRGCPGRRQGNSVVRLGLGYLRRYAPGIRWAHADPTPVLGRCSRPVCGHEGSNQLAHLGQSVGP